MPHHRFQMVILRGIQIIRIMPCRRSYTGTLKRVREFNETRPKGEYAALVPTLNGRSVYHA
ncbi:MAG: hypothetical protein ACYC35_28015 [Pirellulales bacterium]